MIDPEQIQQRRIDKTLNQGEDALMDRLLDEIIDDGEDVRKQAMIRHMAEAKEVK